MAAGLSLAVSPLRVAAEAVLRPYGQILLSRDLRSGLLVLAAVATFPKLALATLLAVAVAGLVTLLFGLGLPAVREGGYGCTAVLTTLATGVFAPGGGHPIVLVVVGAVVAVWLTASFEAVFASVTLPTHSFPFVFSAWLVHLAARSLPAPADPLSLTEPLSALPQWLLAESWLDVPAALLFLHGAAAGVAVIAAVALHSRIALLLGAVGALVAVGLRLVLRAEVPWSTIDLVASFNAVLAAVALGGVWFVPQPSSLLLAAVGSAVTVFVSYALAPLASITMLPVLSLPFVVTTHLVLMAARRRLVDRRPHSAWPADRPEEALSHHLTRVRRFGDASWLPFRLPFRGVWVVTQGHDGKHTHRGPWRHGLDFEVLGPDERPTKGAGAELRDYHSYGLPVVAAGAGTVASVTDDVEDNPPGQINTHDRWGNAVVIAHGPNLYSVYAHLKPHSITVRPGEIVPAGREIARCGNSGRSPIPHLHFQVQRAAALGSPTLPVDFGDVVTEHDDEHVVANLVVPREGHKVRPIMRDDGIARALAFPPGATFELSEQGGGTERARVEVDLLGRRMLSTDRARLFIDPYDSGFVVVDFYGDPRSLLRYVLIALARVPFDQARALRWTDNLPRRLLLPGPLRSLADLLAVVLPAAGHTPVAYEYSRQPGTLVIRGVREGWESKATLSLGAGAHEIEVRRGGESHTIVMRPLEATADAEGARP